MIDFACVSSTTPTWSNYDPAVESEAGAAQKAESMEFPEGGELATAVAPPQAPALTPAPRASPEDVLADMAKFLEKDLRRLVDTGRLTDSRYSKDILFADPTVNVRGLDTYKLLMNSMRFLFKCKFDIYSTRITGPDQVTVTWAMTLSQEQLPWQPDVVLSGKTIYGIDVDRALVLSHVDEWDSADHNKFFSIDAFQDITTQLFKMKNTPNLEAPPYTVVRRRKKYEIRKYTPFVVAETAMAAGAGPASGSGFNDLAKFIFGGNDKRLNMPMTMPVFSTAAQAGDSGNRMQFVMGSRYAAPEDVPAPESSGVVCRTEDPGLVAAIEFSGWPMDFEVVRAEQELRKMLLADGLAPEKGYKLARYNDPTTLPMFRRNEVLIKVGSVDF
eukprot:jgi/Tetstr1/443610/TSEL_031609.t1